MIQMPREIFLQLLWAIEKDITPKDRIGVNFDDHPFFLINLFSVSAKLFAGVSNSSSEDSLSLLSLVVSIFSGSGEADEDILKTDITNTTDSPTK